MPITNEFIGTLDLIWHYRLINVGEVELSLGSVLIALMLLAFSARLSRLVVRQINRRLIVPFVPDAGSQNTYQTFVFYGCLALFVALSLTIAGIPLTIFTVLGGAFAIGVGFGSQNIINNFISGMILLMERPIKVGDVVEVENIIGKVIAIGTRSTKIRNTDNKVFIIPNSFFLEKSVMNWTHEDNLVRTFVDFGVAYGSDVRLVENACMDILLNVEGVEQAPVPRVHFLDFAESTLNFQLIFFCDFNKIVSLAQVRSDIRFKIEERFRHLNIQMAFPQRDLHLIQKKPLEVSVLS
jgi:potassium-dependent mechanosensitive channel